MARLWTRPQTRSLMAALLAVVASLLLILAILFLGINSIRNTHDMSRAAAELHQAELLGISRIREANIHLIAAGRALRQMVLAPTFVDRDEARALLGQALAGVQAEMAAAHAGISREQEKLFFNEFEREFEQYQRNVADAVKLVDSSRDYQVKATAYVTGAQFGQVADAADLLLHRLVASKEENARATVAALAQHARDAQWLALQLLLGSVLSGATAGVAIWYSAKSVQRRRRHRIDRPVEKSAGDVPLQAVSRQHTGAERQSTAPPLPQVEFIGAETLYAVDGGVAPRAPASGYVAGIRNDQSGWERFQSFDGSRSAPIARASILVLEDDASAHEVTAGLAAIPGCEVTVATDGQAALALLERNTYDVVLMNLQMPMTEGISTTQEIRKKSAFSTLPIIALTANGSHRDRERCLNAGMDGLIAGPIDPAGLFGALMCWIAPPAVYADSRRAVTTAGGQRL